MKDVLDTLRQVREKSKHTVDNSSLKKLDDAILTLEKRIEKIFALIKLLSGDSDFH